MGGSNFLQERSFRARLDLASPTLDGSWAAAQDTAWNQNSAEKFRLRIGVRRFQPGGATLTSAFRLVFMVNGAGGWKEVTPTASYVRPATSVHYDHQDDFNGPGENFLITATPLDPPNGAYCEGFAVTGSAFWTGANRGCEYEFCLEFAPGVAVHDDIVEFKMQRQNGDDFASAQVFTPTLTVVKRGAIDGAGNIGQVVSGSGSIAATVQGAGYFGPSVKGSGVIRPEGS